jgi:membrane protease YdiL (CAAX protease family)
VLFGNDAWPTWIDKLVFASTSFVVGPREEIAYRAVLQNMLERRLGWIAALILSSVLFALYHYGYGGIPFTPRRFAELFFSGVGFGLLYRFSGSLLAVALLHSVEDVLWSLSPWLAVPLPAAVRGLIDAAAAMLLSLAWVRRSRNSGTSVS